MDLKRRISALAAAVVMAIGCGTHAFAAEALCEAEVYREFYATKTVSTVKASEKPGTYEENLYVELSCSTRGARIFYTTDGSTPDIHSEEYDGDAIRIKGKAGDTVEVAIRAIAVKTGYNDSEIAEFQYIVEIPAELDVYYMEIDTEPRKLRYDKGEALDLTGGYIVVTYEDGTYKDIPMTESMISGFNSNTAGEKLLTVTYAELTDTFTVVVKFSESTIVQDNTTQENTTELDKAAIQGTEIVGWEAIRNELLRKTKGISVAIETNGSVSIPAEVILAAMERKLTLEFVIDKTTSWTLKASAITDDAVPVIGLGLRTDGVYIPDVVLNEAGGEVAGLIHFNSDNRLSARYNSTVDEQLKGEFASLYRYDESKSALVLVDTDMIGQSSEVELVPDLRGDYVIIADGATRIKGDINNSMTVTPADASMLLKLLVGDGTDDPKADFNDDGIISPADASAILLSTVS